MTSATRQRWRRKRFAAVGVALAIGVTACGSGGSSGSSSSSAGSSSGGAASVDSVLGAAKKATGTPVKIGLITEGKTEAVDNSQQLPLAEATTKYINEHLGGLGGHTLDLVGCEANGTPQGATKCINELIQADVAAVISPQYGESGQAAKTFTAMNIPVIEYQAGTPEELTSPHSYSIGGGIISLSGAVGADLLEKNLKRVAILMINLPAVTQAVTTFAAPAYEKAGLTADLVPIAPGTADMTPFIATAERKNPDAYWIFGNAAFCVAGGQALQSQGVTKPIYFLPNCVGAALAKGTQTEGTLSGSPIKLDPADPEMKLYNAVIKQYDPKITDEPANVAGVYVPLVALARVLENSTGDLDAASIDKAMAAARDVKAPLGGGNTFTCGGTAFPPLKAFCSTFAFVTPLDKDAKPTAYNPVDTSKIFSQ